MPVFIELSLTELIIAERKSKFSEQDTGLFLQSTTIPAYGHLRPSFRGLPVHLASFRPTERYVVILKFIVEICFLVGSYDY